jgi:predicted site-specific integrase-resolvase
MYQSMQKMREIPETASVGNMWTVKEEQQLIESLSGDKSIDDIAKEHKRTPGGIKSRINFMAVNMLEKKEKSIDDVCAIFRLAKHELEYRQAKFASKKEKAKQVNDTDETQIDVLKDIREILLRMEVKLLERSV